MNAGGASPRAYLFYDRERRSGYDIILVVEVLAGPKSVFSRSIVGITGINFFDQRHPN